MSSFVGCFVGDVSNPCQFEECRRARTSKTVDAVQLLILLEGVFLTEESSRSAARDRFEETFGTFARLGKKNGRDRFVAHKLGLQNSATADEALHTQNSSETIPACRRGTPEAAQPPWTKTEKPKKAP